VNAAADDGVDVDVEVGILGQDLEFLIEDFKALSSTTSSAGRVDRNLHVAEAGLVEAFDALGTSHGAVGDHAGEDAAAAHGGDDFVESGWSRGSHRRA